MDDRIGEYIAGNAAGWSVITLGQPLDYLKTISQLNQKYSLRHLFSFNNFNILYRGSSSLYLLAGTVASFQFFIFQRVKSMLDSSNKQPFNNFLAGASVGSTIAFIYTPNQFVKIEAQTSKDAHPKGSLRRLFEYVVKQPGGIRKIYRGLSWCLLREIPGSAVYYGCYHYYLNTFFRQTREQAQYYAQICSGGLAGISYQLWAYPIDAIKTNLQAQNKTFQQLKAAKIWKGRKFWQGFGYSLGRSVITDAVAFTVYERVRKYFKSSFLY